MKPISLSPKFENIDWIERYCKPFCITVNIYRSCLLETVCSLICTELENICDSQWSDMKGNSEIWRWVQLWHLIAHPGEEERKQKNSRNNLRGYKFLNLPTIVTSMKNVDSYASLPPQLVVKITILRYFQYLRKPL